MEDGGEEPDRSVLPRRRALALGVGVVGTGASGWLLTTNVIGGGAGPVDDPPTGIDHVVFERDPDEIPFDVYVKRGDREVALPADDPPTVVFSADRTAVEIAGVHWHGDRECWTTTLDAIRYDRDHGTVEVIIVEESTATLSERLFGRGCTAILTARPYYVRLVFEAEVPGEVTVVEEHSSERYRFTSTR